MKGKLTGIGVGPGDPELLTIKAVSYIKNAGIIITPKTEKLDKSSALNIVRSYIPDNAEIIYQVFPMIKNKEERKQAWQKNSNEILDFINSGKNVIFLTLGDPMIYSTYIYIFKELKKHSVEINNIPGITSFLDLANRTGFQLAEWKETLKIIPATVDELKLDRELSSGDNLVLMKVYKNFANIKEKLKKFGYNKVLVGSRCGMTDELITYDIESINHEEINYFTTIIAKKDL